MLPVNFIMSATIRMLHVNFIVSVESIAIPFLLSKIFTTIHEGYQFLAATPDSIIECECFGQGLLEIKCPYCIRDGEPDVANSLNDGKTTNIIIKHKHRCLSAVVNMGIL